MIPVGRRTGIYVRISKDRSGLMVGVARQEDDCRAYAKEKKWDVAEIYVENDTSAFKSRKPRPEWQRLLADIRSGAINSVLAQHPDRFNKGGHDLEDLIDAVEASHCLVDTVDYQHYDLSTRSGRMLARIIGVVARDESEAKAERYVNKHAELARKGRWKGGPRPYGYSLVLREPGAHQGTGKLAVVDEEADVIRESAERVLAGEALYSICADLDRRGVPTAQGATWRTPTLRRILTSHTHAGKREYRGEAVCRATWSPIIDEVTHRRLRLLLLDNRRRVGRRARVFLLTGGFARCALCGARLIGHRREYGARTYVCLKVLGGEGCGGIHCIAEPLEELVTEAVMIRLDTPDLARLVKDSGKGRPDRVADAETELAQATGRLDELGEMWAHDQISKAEFLRLGKPVRDRADAAERRLNTLLRRNRTVPWTGKAGVLRAAWPTMSLDQRRAVIDAVVDQVVINPTKIRGRFDPDRVDVIWRA